MTWDYTLDTSSDQCYMDHMGAALDLDSSLQHLLCYIHCLLLFYLFIYLLVLDIEQTFGIIGMYYPISNFLTMILTFSS